MSKEDVWCSVDGENRECMETALKLEVLVKGPTTKYPIIVR
jgi:hypothetical protein